MGRGTTRPPIGPKAPRPRPQPMTAHLICITQVLLCQIFPIDPTDQSENSFFHPQGTLPWQPTFETGTFVKLNLSLVSNGTEKLRQLHTVGLIRGREGPGHKAPHQQPAYHQTVHILFLANDRCLRDYDLVVAHCWSLF